jgi:hypothetical protein
VFVVIEKKTQTKRKEIATAANASFLIILRITKMKGSSKTPKTGGHKQRD